MTEPMSQTNRPEEPVFVAPRRQRWRIVVPLLLVLIVALIVVADHITLDYYAIQPGIAEAVAPLIHVPPGKAHRSDRSVLLTDVYLSPVTLLGLVPDLLSSNTDLVPSSEVLGPHTPASELTGEGYLEMARSQSSAKSLAFRTLGYTVPEHDVGVLVFSVEPGSPAYPVLKVGQIVTAVNGTPTPNACAFVAALHSKAAGTVVRLSVEQSTVSPEAVIESGPMVKHSVRLARASPQTASSGCPGVNGPAKGFLGVSIETQKSYTYPFPVRIDTSSIGGPSAGLAMTLGIIDKLSNGNMTSRHVVAATGTIGSSGEVGDVSGVAQKTVAVERAGATVFLVPPQELAAAKSKATPGLHVYAVSSLSQALAVLRRLGAGHPARR